MSRDSAFSAVSGAQNRSIATEQRNCPAQSSTGTRPSRRRTVTALRRNQRRRNDINGIPHSQKMPHQREPAKLTITDLKKTHAGYHPREKDQGRD